MSRKMNEPEAVDQESGIATGASLSAQLRELRKVKLHRWLAGLAGDWVVMVAVLVAAGWADHLAAYAGAVFILGTRQHAIGILAHDGAHRLASRHRRLNDYLTQVFCFWPLCADLSGYRPFHFGHHNNLNTAEDPELVYRRLGAPEWDVPCKPPHLGLRFLKDLVGLGAVESFRVLYSVRPSRFRSYLGLGVFWAAIAAVAVLSGTLWVLALWFLALFTSFAAVWRFRCWIEHIGSDDTHRVSMPRWMSWLVAPHNVWAHWEHHKWPGIPYWSLPRARKLDDSIPVTSIWELLRYWGHCPPVKTGAPTRDKRGSLLPTTS